MQKKFAGLVAVSLVLVVTLVVILAVVFTTHDEVSDSGDPVTFDEYLSSNFSAKLFNGSWWSPRELQWQDADSNLVTWNVESGQTTVLVSAQMVSLVSATASFVSFAPSDKSLLLFSDKRTPVWRHSFLAQYIVLDSGNNNTITIVPKDSPEEQLLQYAQWVPNSTFLIYVHQNNMYVRKVLDDPTSDIQLTTDGKVDTVYNGIPDWVYEEEILSTNKAMYFPASGTKVAFAQFNDTQVEEFFYTKYGDPSDPIAAQYPQQIGLKYPKAGRSNPTVNIMVASITGSGLKPVIPPQEVTDYTRGYLYSTATWISDERLSIIWLNRVQNRSSVSECSETAKEWVCKSLYSQSQTGGWLDVFQPPVYRSDGMALLQIQPRSIEQKSYPHIKLITLGSDGSLEKETFITAGQMVVTKILGWQEDQNTVYFVATAINDPGTRHLYYAKTDPDSTSMQCLTCELETVRDKSVCRYNDISMSSDHVYYMHTCRGPRVPEVVLRSTSDHKPVHVFEDNVDLVERLDNKALTERMDLRIDVGEEGFEANVVLRLPKNYDGSATAKYPLLVYVYGGPGSQTVDQRWSVNWQDYLASNYDVVYASIDGRGTGFQSNEFLYQVFHSLGTVEMQDQIDVTKQLLSQFPFLDPARTGIWGWSYGGYATAMTLIQDEENVFKCGLSVAPPTNWLFYDSMYTERFMGLPMVEDNLDGYNTSSLLNRVESLRGKKFALNHGVADDNVHYQQSMLLMRALELADIEFEQHSYPDENHGLGGVRRAVYHHFDSFWASCFGYESTYSSP